MDRDLGEEEGGWFFGGLVFVWVEVEWYLLRL